MTTDVGSFKSYQLSEGRTTPVSARVSPTDRIRGEIEALFDDSKRGRSSPPLKNEMYHRQPFSTQVRARFVVDDYIEVFYNRRRVRFTLGYRTPHEALAEYLTAGTTA